MPIVKKSKLVRPTRAFAKCPLVTVSISPSNVFRISRHKSGEPYFGKSGANRFDDPGLPKSKRFGTCYCGLTLGVAFAETVLHDEVPMDGHFDLAPESIESRYVVQFAGEDLILADLTGPALKRSGIDSSLSTTADYNLPQQWSVAVHKHPFGVDGFVYMSRHANSEKAIVLFDRAKAKFTSSTYEPLATFPAALQTIMTFGVRINYV